MPKDLATIQALLAERTGLDPVSVGTGLIPRAVRLRMTELGLRTTGEYALLVRGSEAELQALIEEVVIPESWFFRDELPFRFLQEHVRRTYVGERTRAPVRVLSVPCAGGEEPYSIAIALSQIGLSNRQFRVDAVDISARRIEHARRGVYSKNAFRGGGDDYRAKYFRECAGGYEVEPDVRASVRFARGSILDPSVLSGEPRYDVVFCRNLLIYLDRPSRARAMATLDRLLAEDGLLVIGHADRLNATEAEPRFAPVGDRGAFCYRRAPVPSPPQDRAVPAAPRGRDLPDQTTCRRDLPVPPQEVPPQEVLGRIGTGRSLPRRQQDSPVSGQSAAAALLEQASSLANRGRHDEAIVLCEHDLQLRGPSAAAFHLMGVIRQAAGDRRRAEDCFRKAVYLDPGHDAALLALALCAERRGDAAAAAGLRRRAERAALEKGVR
jgi:chemotaxis protein methyltransferase WspC